VAVTGADPTLLAGAAARHPDHPLLTFCDDATGERTALSVAALGGWAARVAALLRDGCRLRPGGRAAVLLPPHWQTAAVLLGAWSAGIAVSLRPLAIAGRPVLGPGARGTYDAVFVSAARLDDRLEDVPEGNHRFVLDVGPTAPRSRPAGWLDFLPQVGRYAGALPAASLGTATAATVDGTTFREFGAVALGMAEMLGLRAGDRLLIDAAEHEEPLKWLLAPLAVGASVVLCANLDRTALPARIAAEGVTRVL
jgi:uncharacterized protein (TIGR03089 family)